MDEYCGYDVEDVHSGTELDEVMCETCGTIQPAVNEMCSYCGTKLKNGGTKKSKKKCRKESGDYVPARKKINCRPAENSAAEKSVKLPKPVEASKPVLEKSEPIINPPRPAKSISRQRRYDDDTPICASIDDKTRNYVDSEEKEMKILKKSLVIIIVIFLVCFGILKKGEKKYAYNPFNFSTPVTQGINGDYTFDCEDSSYLLIGRELPVGEYFLHCTEYGQGHIKVSNFDTCEIIFTADFDKSFYVTLKEGDVLSFINCELYILKEPSGLNRPFGQPGMFKVGFDLEPGKYNVVPYGNDEEPVVRIHKDSKYDIDSFSDNAFPEKGKIKVKKGDYLELDNCILEKE